MGVPQNFPPQILFFYDLNQVQFQNPRTTCSGRKVTWGEKREEEKMPLRFPLRFACNALGQRTHFIHNNYYWQIHSACNTQGLNYFSGY